MIESVQFRNYKVLRNTELPLGRFTLLVGPNGSGKSTALQALRHVAHASDIPENRILSIGVSPKEDRVSEVRVVFGSPFDMVLRTRWEKGGVSGPHVEWRGGGARSDDMARAARTALQTLPIYSFEAAKLAAVVQLQPNMRLGPDGTGLAAVLDRLRDQAPERFEELNADLSRWLPEFDRILFETPGSGIRAFSLRVRGSKSAVAAQDVSHGTLLALAILTLAHEAEVNPIMCFEEPDRGLHPRLLRDVRDALYRLSYPDKYGDSRKPVQVIATTHSPYLLDLFREHPDEIVICQKDGRSALFEQLARRPDIEEILADVHLGEAWYSGVLGGVPDGP